MTTTATAMTQLMRLQQITCGHFKADDGTFKQIKNNRIDRTYGHVLDEIQGKVCNMGTLEERYSNNSRTLKKSMGITLCNLLW